MANESKRVKDRIEGNVLTADEAADYLKIGRKTAIRLFISGEIPARKVGREWRVLRSFVDNYMLMQ